METTLDFGINFKTVIVTLLAVACLLAIRWVVRNCIKEFSKIMHLGRLEAEAEFKERQKDK